MLKFLFIEKNGSGIMTITAPDFETAQSDFNEIVTNPEGWRCENEDGEDF